MGNCSFISNKNNYQESAANTFLKNSSLGKHIKDNNKNEQYLILSPVIQSAPDLSHRNAQFKDTISKRLKVFNKNIPQILKFSQKSNQFCSIDDHAYQIHMVHPLRSLKQEIEERQYVNEPFTEGEIWMVIFSTFNALASYEYLGIRMKLQATNIYISNNGDIVVSDAFLYTSINSYIKNKEAGDVNQNVKQMLKIIRQMMKKEEIFSAVLLNLIKKLQINQFSNYRRIVALIFEQKSRDQTKRRSQQYFNIEEVVTQYTENENKSGELLRLPLSSIPLQSNQRKLNFNKFLSFHPLSNQPYENSIFHRSTQSYSYPFTQKQQKSPKTQLNLNFSTELSTPQLKSTGTIEDFSTITQLTKNSQQIVRKQETGERLTSFLEEDQGFLEINNQKVDQLWKKNTELLQNLILRQQSHMIMQVTESEIDLSERRSYLPLLKGSPKA